MEIKTAFGAGNLAARSMPEALTENELIDCRGGQIPAAFWWSIVGIVVSNWQDVREGFSDGASGKAPRYSN